MNIGKKYTNAIESKMIIREISIDYFGDHLLKMGFKYINEEIFKYGKISNIIIGNRTLKSKAFEGTFSIN